MGEASGKIAIKAPKEITDQLFPERRRLPWDAVIKLAEFAGIGPLTKLSVELECRDGQEFGLEGDTETIGDFTVITPFGTEWMDICEALAKTGGAEVYGAIFSEYQTNYYFARTEETIYFEKVDWEISKNTDRVEEIVKNWKAIIPRELQARLFEFIN